MSAPVISQELATNYMGRLLNAKKLPALPDAVHEISRLMESGNISTDRVAVVIERDQALAVKVLKMVNSPIYGFPGRISTVRNALMLLGINVIRGLLISSSVFDLSNNKLLALWQHSLACSLAAVEIAKAAGLAQPEEYSIMGLLHDTGKVVGSIHIPEARAAIDKLVKEEDLTFIEAEVRVLGFGHDKINVWLCEHWNLPLVLKEAMSYHHSPLDAKFHPEAAAVVHVADFMARLFECGSGGDDNVSLLSPKALRLLGLNHAKLELLLDRVIGLYSDRANLSVS
jgi:HD-like signal output (HDOD) protein